MKKDNPHLRGADMDIVQPFTDQSFDEVNKSRGVNPVAISDQHNRLGTVSGLLVLHGIRNRGGRRGLGGFCVGFDLIVCFVGFIVLLAKNFLKIGDEARRQEVVLDGSGSHIIDGYVEEK